MLTVLPIKGQRHGGRGPNEKEKVERREGREGRWNFETLH